MSSSAAREPLPALIRQNERVVGAVCLPEKNVLDFINEFNHCYGPLQLHIDPPKPSGDSPQSIFPVGAQRKTSLIQRTKPSEEE